MVHMKREQKRENRVSKSQEAEKQRQDKAVIVMCQDISSVPNMQAISARNRTISSVASGPVMTFFCRNTCGDDTSGYHHPNNPRNGVHVVTGAEMSILEIRITTLVVDVGDEGERNQLEDGMKSDEPCDGSPNPSSSGMGANSKQQRYERHGAESNTQLRSVACAGP